MADKRVYKVVFYNRGQVYELFARNVFQGGLYGFLEIEGLLFGERSQVVVDPTEERLKSEFEGVKRIYVPVHAVVRVDEVEKQGVSKISETSSDERKVMAFPVPGRGPDDGQ